MLHKVQQYSLKWLCTSVWIQSVCVGYSPWEMSQELRSPWTLWWSSWACSWWPRPPAWWCSVGQTGPWLTPRTGSPSSASRSSPPSESWWPQGFLSSQQASVGLCKPPRTPLKKEKEKTSRRSKWKRSVSEQNNKAAYTSKALQETGSDSAGTTKALLGGVFFMFPPCIENRTQ